MRMRIYTENARLIQRPSTFALGALAVLLAGACSEPKAPEAPRPPGEHGFVLGSRQSEPRVWKSSIAKDHPLVGHFYETATWREVSEADVENAAAAATYVLVGEKHDNADHHVEQARILGGMIERQKRPAVVFEMIETDMADKLASYMDRGAVNAKDFGDAMSWEKRGWGPWENYQPIMEVVIAAKLPVVAGGIPIARAIDIAHHAEAAVSEEDRKTYLLDETMDPNLESSLHEELVQAHCGHMPSTMVRGMLLAERARDAGLASAMLAHGDSGAILIAGNGHTRTDRGVPWALRKKAPDAKVVSIAMIEAEDGHVSPKEYGIHADYTFFTPRETDEDPCEKFKAELKRQHHEHE